MSSSPFNTKGKNFTLLNSIVSHLIFLKNLPGRAARISWRNLLKTICRSVMLLSDNKRSLRILLKAFCNAIKCSCVG